MIARNALKGAILNIWIVNQFAVPPSQSGGTRHFALAREMKKQDVDVTIIASAVNYQSGQKIVFPDSKRHLLQQQEGVSFLWLQSVFDHGSSGFSRVAAMIDFLTKLMSRRAIKLLKKPDVIVGSSPQPFAALGALIMAKRLKVPFVLEIRDLWPDSLLDLGGYSKWHPFILLLSFIERLLYRRADAIVTLLPHASDTIIQKGGESSKITWIPNGVDLSTFKASENSSGAIIERDPDEFVVLYAGAHGLANGLDTLLDAAKQLKASSNSKKVRFVLVGAGPQKKALVARKQSENIKNVDFLPPVPKSEIPRLLSQADAFYMPLKDSPVFRWGISPNKLFDYMAAAKPVIFAVNSRFNPVNEAEAGISIHAESPDELEQAVLRLAALSQEEREDMGRNGHAYVSEHHDHAKLAVRLEGLLRKTSQKLS